MIYADRENETMTMDTRISAFPFQHRLFILICRVSCECFSELTQNARTEAPLSVIFTFGSFFGVKVKHKKAFNRKKLFCFLFLGRRRMLISEIVQLIGEMSWESFLSDWFRFCVAYGRRKKRKKKLIRSVSMRLGRGLVRGWCQKADSNGNYFFRMNFCALEWAGFIEPHNYFNILKWCWAVQHFHFWNIFVFHMLICFIIKYW